MFDARVWGTVAEWLAGVGTLAAVIVALWLARRPPPEFVSWEMFVIRPDTGEDYVSLMLRNTGMADVWITHVQLYLTEKVQTIKPDKYKVPLRLEPGQQHRFVFVIGRGEPFDNEAHAYFESGRGKRYVAPLFSKGVLWGTGGSGVGELVDR